MTAQSVSSSTRAGFLIVDKPKGVSSNQVVGAVKRATGVKKVGHAGTLDPMATGTMVIAIGKVTRLIRFIQDLPKEYRATAEFGIATDTLDAEGAILSRVEMDLNRSDLETVTPRFMGEVMQVPPMVSALKRDGRRLYELAREGVNVAREARPVRIDELEIISVGPGPYPEVEFRVVCGKGTYIRSLADDMAAALGGAAHLSALRRLRIGSLRAEEGLVMDDLSNWHARFLTPSQALIDLPVVVVDDEVVAAVRNGIRFAGGPLTKAPENTPFRVVGPDSDLVAVYSRSGDHSHPEVVLAK